MLTIASNRSCTHKRLLWFKKNISYYLNLFTIMPQPKQQNLEFNLKEMKEICCGP